MDIEDPVIVAIARRLGVHPAVVCVKWAAQRGAAPIPFSVNPRNYLANLQGVVGPPLTDADMAAIAGIDRNCRLIKGQVFLWKTGPDLGRSLGPGRSDQTMTRRVSCPATAPSN